MCGDYNLLIAAGALFSDSKPIGMCGDCNPEDVLVVLFLNSKSIGTHGDYNPKVKHGDCNHCSSSSGDSNLLAIKKLQKIH